MTLLFQSINRMECSYQACREVHKLWPRKADGPPLTHKNAPVGIRTPNGQPWGHDIEDFYWIQRVPGVRCMTVWSISMIREFGERDGDLENRFEDDTGDVRSARVRKPWPLLKLPDGVHCDQDLGREDEGSSCAHSSDPKRRRGSARWDTASGESSESSAYDPQQAVCEASDDEPVVVRGRPSAGSDLVLEDSSKALENDTKQAVCEPADHEPGIVKVSSSLRSPGVDSPDSADQVAGGILTLTTRQCLLSSTNRAR